MLEDLRIRRATETDDHQLAAIAYDAWSPDASPGPLPDPATIFDDAEGISVDNTLVAFLPEAVAGFVAITAYPYGHRQWDIRALAVDTLFRRRGIGLMLVRAAAAATHTAGGLQLRAEVPAAATSVQRLLTRAGFTVQPRTSERSTHTEAAVPNTSAGIVVMVDNSLHRPGT